MIHILLGSDTVKKVAYPGIKLLCLAGFAALLAFWYFLDLPCVFRHLTGIPCITCGMTRAWTAALQGDFSTAFRQHPMFWSFPVLLAFAFFDGQLLPGKKANACTLGLLVAGLFVLYLARIFDFLGALLPL